MIAHPCQWEPEYSAMSPPAELLPAKKRKAGAYSPCLSIYQGIAATPELSPFPVPPGAELSSITANHSPRGIARERRGFVLFHSERVQKTTAEGERGMRMSAAENNLGYATDRSDIAPSSEECVRFSIASFNSSIPNGLSRQTSAPASLRLCRACRLPLMPTT